MMKSNPNIDRASALIATATAAATFTLIAATAAFVAAFGTGRGVYGALDYGRTRLRLNLGQCFCHGILWHRAGNNGRRNGRDLHQHPLSNTHIITRLSPAQYEEIFNHLVASLALYGRRIKRNLALFYLCENRLPLCRTEEP
jgi:hypothetical protein